MKTSSAEEPSAVVEVIRMTLASLPSLVKVNGRGLPAWAVTRNAAPSEVRKLPAPVCPTSTVRERFSAAWVVKYCSLLR